VKLAAVLYCIFIVIVDFKSESQPCVFFLFAHFSRGTLCIVSECFNFSACPTHLRVLISIYRNFRSRSFYKLAKNDRKNFNTFEFGEGLHFHSVLPAVFAPISKPPNRRISSFAQRTRTPVVQFARLCGTMQTEFSFYTVSPSTIIQPTICASNPLTIQFAWKLVF